MILLTHESTSYLYLLHNLNSCNTIYLITSITHLLTYMPQKVFYKSQNRIDFPQHFLTNSIWSVPNGHIFVDSPSIRRRNSTWKIRGNYIDFERRIHVEIMTSIRRGYFDVDSTFKIDEISMSSPRGFFYVVSASNRRNFCTRCFHFITFSALGTYSKLFWYNTESL